nr:4384_t:CDS:2 [Entrophospora candida]
MHGPGNSEVGEALKELDSYSITLLTFAEYAGSSEGTIKSASQQSLIVGATSPNIGATTQRIVYTTGTAT